MTEVMEAAKPRQAIVVEPAVIFPAVEGGSGGVALFFLESIADALDCDFRSLLAAWRQAKMPGQKIGKRYVTTAEGLQQFVHSGCFAYLPRNRTKKA